MRLAVRSLIVAFMLALVGMVGNASADPVNSPNVSFGMFVCGDVTYTVVSPNHAPVGQVLTANGSNSTTVGVMVVDKAGSAFPQNLLTLCTAYPPPPDEPFQFYALITPVG